VTDLGDHVLRTPEDRFSDLPDYPFESKYCEVAGLRMHYVDEGPREANPILMLHGEPSWSYLYRHMIPPCAERHRVLAPDLIGFGKSDKPASIRAYSYQAHIDWMREFLESLDLRDITLVCQDWGSLIGLRLAAEQEQRFARIVVGNGMLVTGDRPMPTIFRVWRAFARFSPWFPISRIVDKGCFRNLSAGERRAYDAPFPAARYKAGSRAFPRLVPTSPSDPAAAACRLAWEALGRWEKPFLTTFSNGDPITRGADRFLRKHVPGAHGQPHETLRGGHFLQEDAGPEFARAIVDWLAGASR
jgi:haloalkane dehalogenase